MNSNAEVAAADLHAALDVLLTVDLSALGTVDLTGLLDDMERARRRMTGVDHRVLAEIDQRGVAGEFGRTSTAELLMTRLRVAPGEARARVAQARETQPTQLPSGEQVAAVLPRCAAAVTAGQISAAHVSVISKTLATLPAPTAYEVWPVAEQLLVDAATHQHPGAVAQTGALLLARLDPDGVEPREDQYERRRGFDLIKNAAGGARVHGEWTPEVTALWETILAATSAPLPAGDGTPDQRSASQRRHDAMAEAATRLLRSGTLSSADGLPVTVLLRTTPADLDRPGDTGGTGGTGGMAVTATGDIWPTARVHVNLGDAGIVPVLFDADGAALVCGRTRRLAGRTQRLALAARDGGCVFPGCTRPAGWCEAHHVREWTDGGDTDIDNLCLLCRFHHREFARRDWAVTMIDGRPAWTPPPWIDPDQRPVRNTAHHPPEIDFTSDVDIGDTG